MKPEWRQRLRVMACDILAMLLGLRDPRVPRPAKVLMVAALVYAIVPFDLVPDFVPLVGWLDDLAVLPLAATLATKFVPFDLLRNLRRQADGRLTLWGFRAGWYIALFLAVWLALAATGGWLTWRHFRAAARPDPAGEIGRILQERGVLPSPGEPETGLVHRQD